MVLIYFFLSLSCPQAPSISPPSSRLTVAGMPARSSRAAISAALLLPEPLKPVSSTLLSGMRFTWQSIPPRRFIIRFTSSSESFSPLIRAYSKVILLRVQSVDLSAASRSMSKGYFLLTGIILLRPSSVSLCSDIARLTWGKSSPKRSITGTIPLVETVMLR